jgi:uncharacterized protein with HEPN domain
MRSPRLQLKDILDAVAEIEHYLPTTVEEFDVNPPIQSHVVRQIAIIGEVASRLPKSIREAHAEIPWRQISGMRNIIVHVYHGINWHRVFETARRDVAALKPQIQAILDSLPPDDSV